MIAYLTHDAVNAALARRMARRLGSDLTILRAQDADQLGAADRLVIDLDNLPRESKSELFRRAENGGLLTGVAVHSYNLTGAEARILRAAGVRVARRLTAALLADGPGGGTPDRTTQNAGSGSEPITL
jgi:hypothetical protein